MTCFSVDTRVVPFFFFRLRPISSSHRAHFLVRGWHHFALFCFSWSAAGHSFFAMSGGRTFRNDFSTRTRCWRTGSAAFLDRTTASSASLRLPQSVISGISVAWIFKFTVLFALVLIGLFVVVPKADAKPHLFISLSYLLCAASSFQGV